MSMGDLYSCHFQSLRQEENTKVASEINDHKTQVELLYENICVFPSDTLLHILFSSPAIFRNLLIFYKLRAEGTTGTSYSSLTG